MAGKKKKKKKKKNKKNKKNKAKNNPTANKVITQKKAQTSSSSSANSNNANNDVNTSSNNTSNNTSTTTTNQVQLKNKKDNKTTDHDEVSNDEVDVDYYKNPNKSPPLVANNAFAMLDSDEEDDVPTTKQKKNKKMDDKKKKKKKIMMDITTTTTTTAATNNHNHYNDHDDVYDLDHDEVDIDDHNLNDEDSIEMVYDGDDHDIDDISHPHDDDNPDNDQLINYEINDINFDIYNDGMMFICTNETYYDCMEQQRFTLPKQHKDMRMVKNLYPNTSALFLFNVNERVLHGIFEPTRPTGPMNTGTWSKNNKRLPAPSVYFKRKHHFEPLPEHTFRHIFNDRNRIRRLDIRELRKIFKLLEQNHIKLTGSSILKSTDVNLANETNNSNSSSSVVNNNVTNNVTQPAQPEIISASSSSSSSSLDPVVSQSSAKSMVKTTSSNKGWVNITKTSIANNNPTIISTAADHSKKLSPNIVNRKNVWSKGLPAKQAPWANKINSQNNTPIVQSTSTSQVQSPTIMPLNEQDRLTINHNMNMNRHLNVTNQPIINPNLNLNNPAQPHNLNNPTQPPPQPQQAMNQIPSHINPNNRNNQVPVHNPNINTHNPAAAANYPTSSPYHVNVNPAKAAYYYNNPTSYNTTATTTALFDNPNTPNKAYKTYTINSPNQATYQPNNQAAAYNETNAAAAAYNNVNRPPTAANHYQSYNSTASTSNDLNTLDLNNHMNNLNSNYPNNQTNNFNLFNSNNPNSLWNDNSSVNTSWDLGGLSSTTDWNNNVNQNANNVVNQSANVVNPNAANQTTNTYGLWNSPNKNTPGWGQQTQTANDTFLTNPNYNTTRNNNNPNDGFINMQQTANHQYTTYNNGNNPNNSANDTLFF